MRCATRAISSIDMQYLKPVEYVLLGLLCTSCAGAADPASLSLKAVLDPALTGSPLEVRVTTTNESDHTITHWNTNLCGCPVHDSLTVMSGVRVYASPQNSMEPTDPAHAKNA